jgi:glycerate kinase
MPLADGGEGTLAVLGGANRTATVTGPLGNMVQAQWGMHKGVAVIEMAQASGLTLAGGADNNDPMGATTRGTGELIDRALNEGAKKIIVCLGGSATTDGGLGALAAISTPARLRAVEFLVACDVDTLFTDAAQVFAPQKGASRAQVALLTNRLEQLAQRYENDFGIDVRKINGSGAAGGLAGALAALGATLMPGFDIVAEEVGFDEAVRNADIVITGEGELDDTSFTGKVVGGVVDYADEAEVPVHAVVGNIDNDMLPELRSLVTATSLTEKFGADMAMQQVLRCIEDAARDILRNTK